MDKQFQIISDSSCDLPPELAREKNIRVVPFYVSFDDKTYLKEVEEVGVREFYQRMVDNPGVYPKSSLPGIQDYYDAFEPYVKEGIPVFCICITTKFSGSMQSALSARGLIGKISPGADPGNGRNCQYGPAGAFSPGSGGYAGKRRRL